MKLFQLIVLFFLGLPVTQASMSYHLSPGWALIKAYSSESDIQNISPDADLIMIYRNQTWLAVSPNAKYTEYLSNKQIDHFSEINAGEALWILSPSTNYASFKNTPPSEKKLSVKQGWNLVSFSGEDKTIQLDTFIQEESGIESVWKYNSYDKQWRAYSPIPAIRNQISNDDEVELIDQISTGQGLWVKSNKNTEITITNLAPFFAHDSEHYEIAEKDMENFGVKAIDPNGDPISYTLSGANSDEFYIASGQIKFKPINTIPKTQYAISVSASDGTTTISRDATITIDLRFENDYNGEYSYNVGSDADHHKQWYLDADHLNINEVHKRYNGSSENGAIVQIVEGGFDTQHPDLIANMDFSMAYDASVLVDGQNGVEGDCTTQSDYSSHGTASAGIVAARGFNGIGVRGIIPFGKLTCFKVPQSELGLHVTLLDKAWLNGPRANNITVSSNSWANCTDFSLYKETILKEGSETLRNGKGRIYVFAAGNHREGYSGCYNNSTNLAKMLNGPYSIVVAAMGKDDTLSETSTPGPNILVSAYGKDVIWTTYTGTFEYASFAGTSAAAPMVSGGVGLLLEACPSLSYRDVKYLLAKHAIQVDQSHSSWIKNEANHYYSTDYGFGKMNILDAINDCQNGYIPLPEEQGFETIAEVNQDIPYTGSALDIAINVEENKKVEWVAVTLDAELSNMGEYEFILSSPAGTSIQLLHANNSVLGSALKTNDYIRQYSNNETFRLSALGFLDEQSQGQWQLSIIDKLTESNQADRLIKKVKMEIIGY